jgi:hypothetical protein
VLTAELRTPHLAARPSPTASVRGGQAAQVPGAVCSPGQMCTSALKLVPGKRGAVQCAGRALRGAVWAARFTCSSWSMMPAARTGEVRAIME